MLDDLNVIAQRDPSDALGVAARQWEQAAFDAVIEQGEHDQRPIENIVVAGMGGSALAALVAKDWLEDELNVPLEVVRNYTLPHYVGAETLVIVSSYSGNTEETIAALEAAAAAGAQIAIVTAGGKLATYAQENDTAYVTLPGGIQPRMAMIYNLRAIVRLFAHFGLVSSDRYDDIAQYASWLKDESAHWLKEVATDKNPAKHLALVSVGKTPIFYSGHSTASLAYKWKISWNENAKNLAFWNELPEFNHNEFVGWASHPVEKPFTIFDLVSNFEHDRTQLRFAVSDKLLSGRRPKSNIIALQGDSRLAQLLWGAVLADFASIYVAILNGVNPTPVDLIEKLKKELTKQ